MKSLFFQASPRRRPGRVGLAVHAGALVLGVAAGWWLWPAISGRDELQLRVPRRPPASALVTAPAAVPSAVAAATSTGFVPSLTGAVNGALIIPVRPAAGGGREAMVLVPVRAREAVVAEPGTRLPAQIGVGGIGGSGDGGGQSLVRTGIVSMPGAVGRVTNGPALARLPERAESELPLRSPVAPLVPEGKRMAETNGVSADDAARAGRSAGAVLECQIGLVRQGISPGSIDGLMGAQTRAAIRVFQERAGLPVTGGVDAGTLLALGTGQPLFTNYAVTAEDVDRLLPLSRTWLGKSQQARLDYETVLELVAERALSHPNLIRQLNPGVNWTNVPVGSVLKIPAVRYPDVTEKAAFLRIRLTARTLQAFGASSNLLSHFPCSIAQRVEKRPIGEELHVATVAPEPNYTFDPAVFPESAEARQLGRKLILQPGPNNPVGSVWIGLDKAGYGIHGTPKPEEVGRTESHGCFRLANWNARHLLQLVGVGTPVEVLP